MNLKLTPLAAVRWEDCPFGFVLWNGRLIMKVEVPALSYTNEFPLAVPVPGLSADDFDKEPTDDEMVQPMRVES